MNHEYDRLVMEEKVRERERMNNNRGRWPRGAFHASLHFFRGMICCTRFRVAHRAPHTCRTAFQFASVRRFASFKLGFYFFVGFLLGRDRGYSIGPFF